MVHISRTVKTIFDLSKESIEALNLLKQNNIKVLIAER